MKKKTLRSALIVTIIISMFMIMHSQFILSVSAETNNEEVVDVNEPTVEETVEEEIVEEITTEENIVEENVLENTGTLREATLTTVYISSNGDDNNSGAEAGLAVKTIEKAMELVSDGGTISFDGSINLTSSIIINKNVIFSYHKESDNLIINTGAELSVETGKTLTVMADGSQAIAAGIIARSGSKIGDGTYKFDFSALSETNRYNSYAIKLEGDSRIQGSAKGLVKINLKDINLLAVGTSTSSAVENADIKLDHLLEGNFSNIVAGAPYTLINTKFEINAPRRRLRPNQKFEMTNSELILNSNGSNNYYGIIFATEPVINDSTIEIKNYGAILLDLDKAKISNSIIKTDGIHTPIGGKPFAARLFGTVENPATFTFTKDIGVIEFKDSNNNSYEYGLPFNHSEVSKDLILPKVTLTFKSEDGSKSRTIDIIKGTSLQLLDKNMFVNNTLIDSSVINELKNEISEATGDLFDYKLLVNGNDNTVYNLSDKINEDTTIVLKAVNNGVRYYLNDGTANAEKYVFVENNEGSNTPLSIDVLKEKESMFKQRGKNFLGWTTDKEGNNPATEIDTTVLTKLYAKWEDKKAFNVTYYRNSPTPSSVSEFEVVTTTLYEGDHLAGVLVDLNNNTNLISEEESEGQSFHNISKAYYQSKFGKKYGDWNWINDYGFINILFNDFSDIYRVQAWNTAIDGSGTYYRGGHTLTAEDFEKTNGELVLYNQWIELEKLKKDDAAAIANPDNARPEIKLSSTDNPLPSDYQSAKDALIVDHSQALNYYAFLNFDKIRSELVTLWGRINEVTEWYGTLNAYFDSRLEFDENIQILFESTWQIPDTAKLSEYGVNDVRQVDGKPNQWIFTINKDFIKNKVVTGRVGTDTQYNSSDYKYYEVKLPVKIIPKYDANGADFQKLSFDDFMKPMMLTVYDNYDRGINAYITKESANKIALSDKPIIIAGGDIQMNINGFERKGLTLLEYQLKSNAYDEHVKLYPSGIVYANYELVEFNDYDDVINALENPLNEVKTYELEGRALNENIVVEDPNNYAEPYEIPVVKYSENGKEKYELVAIDVLIQERNEEGNLVTIGNEVYSNRFYDDAKGTLDEGINKLKGNFAHDKILTFTLKYSEPTIDINVEKKWLDHTSNEIDNLSGSLEVELYYDEVATGKKVSLTSENNWSNKFGFIKKSEIEGKKVSVKELGLNDKNEIVMDEQLFELIETQGNTTDGFVITNKLVNPKFVISGTKTWVDNNNQDGKRPEFITINLLKDGKEFKSVRVDSSNGWKYEFKDLLKYENGVEIKYSITEEKVEGYTTEVNDYNVTNTHEIETIDINITKIWVGKETESIKVKLFANDKQIEAVTITKENGWKYSFNGLNMYEDGKKIKYTIKEEKISGYTNSIKGSAEDGFVITNTQHVNPVTHSVVNTATKTNINLYIVLIIITMLASIIVNKGSSNTKF